MRKPSFDGSPVIAPASPSIPSTPSRRDFLRLACATAAGSVFAVSAGAADQERNKRTAGRRGEARERPDRLSLTAAVGTDPAQLVLFSHAGIVPQQ